MHVEEKDIRQLHLMILECDESPFKINMLAWLEFVFKRRFKKTLGTK